MTIDEMIAVLQAAKDGKEIQWRPVSERLDFPWKDSSATALNFADYQYRVKPEPRTIWVNEYPDQLCAYESEQLAVARAGSDPTNRKAVKYVEVIE